MAKALKQADLVRRILARETGRQDRSKLKMWDLYKVSQNELRRDGKALLGAGVGTKTSERVAKPYRPLQPRGWSLAPTPRAGRR